MKHSNGVAKIVEICSRNDILYHTEQEMLEEATKQLKCEGSEGVHALAELIRELLACRSQKIFEALHVAQRMEPTPELIGAAQEVCSAPALAPQPSRSRFTPEIIGGGRVGWTDGTQSRIASYAKEVLATMAASETGQPPSLVKYTVKEGVAVLTLNDPPANTYSYEMMRQLDARILETRMDESVQVVVIIGAGEKFFCAGANIQMLGNITAEFKYYFCLHANETLSRLEQTPKLVIAAINGHCVGGGLEVAMATDIRVARRHAGKMGLPEVSLGVLPGTGGTQRLARIVGKSRAIELMATGELFDFEKGEALGLINQIFDAETSEQFTARVMEYARQFTAPDRAARAVGRIKRAVQTGAEIPFESALALERELQQQLFLSEDAKEGLDAYANKRKAEFKGK